jgi:hypothetical protein
MRSVFAYTLFHLSRLLWWRIDRRVAPYWRFIIRRTRIRCYDRSAISRKNQSIYIGQFTPVRKIGIRANCANPDLEIEVLTFTMWKTIREDNVSPTFLFGPLLKSGYVEALDSLLSLRERIKMQEAKKRGKDIFALILIVRIFVGYMTLGDMLKPSLAVFASAVVV